MENPAETNGSENLEENAPHDITTPENGGENLPPENAPDFTAADLVSGAASAYEGFDPAIHSVNPDGTPRKKADGTYAMKRGRKPGQTSAPADKPAASPAASTDPGAPKSSAAARKAGVITNAVAARMFARCAVGASSQLLGKHWEPESQEEADALVGAIKEYLDAKGQVQMAPETLLLLTVVGYSAPRVTHPETVSRFGRFVEWAKSALGGVFGRRG